MQAFYSVAIVDPMIGHHFDTLDLISHLPVIVDFWEKTLLGNPVYFGNPMLVHRQLHAVHPLLPGHFDRWLQIFSQTVDELFAGETAELAKARARAIAASLDQRLNPSNDDLVNIAPRQA